jgi:CheY-like chemotaxis protein
MCSLSSVRAARGAERRIARPAGGPPPHHSVTNARAFVSTNDGARVERDALAQTFMRDLASLHVLVVEDDADARELLHAVLEQRGARVTSTPSVAAAVAALRTCRPDIIVSDIAMPEEDGIALAKKVRALPTAEAATPMIAVSAFVANSDRRRAMEAGFDRYFFKPIDFDELCRAIEALAGEAAAIA